MHDKINVYSKFFADKMLGEINKILDAEALNATVCMIYISIDALAYLSMPTQQSETTRKDFINWVDTYLKTDSSQSYQYCGKDFYASRCGKIHTYTPYSSYGKNQNWLPTKISYKLKR